MRKLRGNEGTEATSGEHGEAVVGIVEVTLVWMVVVLQSVVLGIIKYEDVYDVPWYLVVAPAVLPLMVLWAMLVVALYRDHADAVRARRA